MLTCLRVCSHRHALPMIVSRSLSIGVHPRTFRAFWERATRIGASPPRREAIRCSIVLTANLLGDLNHFQYREAPLRAQIDSIVVAAVPPILQSRKVGTAQIRNVCIVAHAAAVRCRIIDAKDVDRTPLPARAQSDGKACAGTKDRRRDCETYRKVTQRQARDVIKFAP